MRKTLRASLLLLVLSCSAHAGVIPNDRTPPPPPPPPPTEPAEGVIPNDSGDGEGETATEITLSLLQSLLALF